MNGDFDEDDDAKEAAELRAHARRLQEVEDFRRLMGSPWGRRLVWQTLDRAGVYRSTYSPEPHHMAFLEGCRNEGLWLMGQIHEHCPDEYLVMIKEHGEQDDDDRNSRADRTDR